MLHEDDTLKLKLYFVPVLLFALGTVAAFRPGWEWFAALVYLIGFVVLGHIAVVSIIRERARYIREEAFRLEEQRRLYEKVSNMTPEEKYFMGIGYVPVEVTVKKTKTEEVKNEFSQTWHKLPIAPYKLKVIAQAMLNGEGFTVRKWAGDDKLLSRNEWDALLESMLQLGMLEWIDPNNHTLGTSWTSFGEDVMTQVLKDSL